MTPGSAPFGVLVDATDVYFSSPSLSAISKCKKGGCSGGPTAAQSTPGQLAQDATAVYWWNYVGGAVVKIAK